MRGSLDFHPKNTLERRQDLGATISEPALRDFHPCSLALEKAVGVDQDQVPEDEAPLVQCPGVPAAAAVALALPAPEESVQAVQGFPGSALAPDNHACSFCLLRIRNLYIA
jgi:hypothetical protein